MKTNTLFPSSVYLSSQPHLTMPAMISGQSVSDGRKVYLSVHYILVVIFAFVLIGVGIDGGRQRVTSIVSYNLFRGLIAMGFLFLVLVLAGMYAAYKSSKPGQVCYHVFLALFSIILISVGGAILTHKDNAAQEIINSWPVAVDSRLSLQYEFTCCGVRQFNDTGAAQPCPLTSTLSCSSALSDLYYDELSTQGSCSVAFGVLIFVMATALLLRTVFDIREGPNATWVNDEGQRYRRHDDTESIERDVTSTSTDTTGASSPVPVAEPVDESASRGKVQVRGTAATGTGYGTLGQHPSV